MVSPWMKHGTVLKYLDQHGRADVNKLVKKPPMPLFQLGFF
jgi:hypothetical protein